MPNLDNGAHIRLETDTTEAVARMRARVTEDKGEIAAELARIDKLLAKGGKANEAKAEEALGILTAKLGEQKPLHELEEKDLAQSVLGIASLFKELGFEFENLDTFTAGEQALIDNAQATLKAAEADRAAADNAWFFNKQSRIESAEAALKSAKEGIETARVEAERQKRMRLMNADMETSLQTFMVRVEDTISIMTDRVGLIDAELKAVSTAKTRAHTTLKTSTKEYERVKANVETLRTKVERAEQDVSNAESGTSERANAEEALSELRKQLVKEEGAMSQSLAVMQSKEKFAQELQIHETTQQKLFDNHKMWIALLKSDSEERVVTFKSRLEAMKADADQMAAKKLAEIGQDVDRSNAHMMARLGSASDDARMQQLETHPERMRQMQQIRKAQAEAHRNINNRFGKFIEEFAKNYGIDPLDASLVNEPQEKNKAA